MGVIAGAEDDVGIIVGAGDDDTRDGVGVGPAVSVLHADKTTSSSSETARDGLIYRLIGK